MTRIALMTAVICVLAPISIPLATLVPISLATLAVMLAGAVLGSRNGALCALLYLILGGIGIPVFAGYSSGFSALVGVTGGFLVGYIPLAFCTGYGQEKKIAGKYSLLAGMIVGTVILYAIGTIWFMFTAKAGFMTALSACVIPFLPGDALKIAAVMVTAPRLRTALKLN